MSDITLLYDSSAVGAINSKKVMVAVPLLYIFMVTPLSHRLITSSKFYASSREQTKPNNDLMISGGDYFFLGWLLSLA